MNQEPVLQDPDQMHQVNHRMYQTHMLRQTVLCEICTTKPADMHASWKSCTRYRYCEGRMLPDVSRPWYAWTMFRMHYEYRYSPPVCRLPGCGDARLETQNPANESSNDTPAKQVLREVALHATGTSREEPVLQTVYGNELDFCHPGQSLPSQIPPNRARRACVRATMLPGPSPVPADGGDEINPSAT